MGNKQICCKTNWLYGEKLSEDKLKMLNDLDYGAD